MKDKHEEGMELSSTLGQVSVEVQRTQIGDVLEDSAKEELIKVTPFMTDPASVTVGAGVTKNMGNYESLRIFVQMTVPCYKEELDDIYPKVRDLVDKKLEAEMAELGDQRKKLL
jgi:hypothetical protein